MAKSSSQKSRDGGRKTYKLRFPHELDAERVCAWVRSVSGTLRSSSTRFTGVPTLTFETWADDKSITHLIKVPWQHDTYVVGQLRALVPGIHVTLEEEHPREKWTRTVEVGLTASSRQLQIYSPADMSTSLLAAVDKLGKNEKMIVQWTLTPAVPSHKPVHNVSKSHEINANTIFGSRQASRDEINDRREKLEEPNMMGVLRVGALASTPVRADHLIHQVRAALASSRGPATRFVKRIATPGAIQRRIDEASGSVIFPMQLSAREVSALIAWPIDTPNVLNMPRPLSKQFPPSPTVPSEGIVVGYSTYPESERPIAIGFNEALMHTEILGKTGVGKSVLMAHMARQMMEAGHGLIVMETEGNLYQAVLDYVPKSRVDDVILMDISDQQHPVGFNVLDQGHQATIIDEILELFQHKYGKDGMGIWSQEYIYHGLRTIAEHPALTFIDLVPLLNPNTTEEVEWVDNITRAIKDQELKRWWQRHDNRGKQGQQQRADTVLSRIWQMGSRPELRHILGQSKSTFQMRDVLTENKILLINLKGISKETASLAGTLVMNALWHAAKNVTKDKPTYVLLDEFAEFMDLPIDTESMLAQARKYKIGMVLAHQHMKQLKPSVRDAVVSNARNKIIFQANTDDGQLLRHELHGKVDVEDLTDLQAHEVIASLMAGFDTSGPMSLKTLPGDRPSGLRDVVRARSRQRWSRPLADVKKEMQDRYVPTKFASNKRPRIGGEGWG